MQQVLVVLAVLASAIAGAQAPKRAAFLVADGTLPLDLVGAYEVLGQARMTVFTVGRTRETVKMSSNLRVVPNYSIADAPAFDILVVPSSFDGDTAVIRWIAERSKTVGHILTVCGGVTPVYDAGLLDGATITSYGPLVDHLKDYAKKATVVTDRRFVDNGQVITCGSYASGIDGALYLVSKLYGLPRAREVANNIEYPWDPQYRYVRARLADNWLAPFVDFGPPLDGRVLRYEGDENRWVAEYEVVRRESFAEFCGQIPEMAAMHHWRGVTTQATDSLYMATWTRQDLANRTWTCKATVRRIKGQTFLLTCEIRRER